MTSARKHSTIVSYFKTLTAEKPSIGAEKLKGGSILSLMKIDVQEPVSKIASKMLNH